MRKVYTLERKRAGTTQHQTIGVFATKDLAKKEASRLRKTGRLHANDYLLVLEQYFDDGIYTKR